MKINLRKFIKEEVGEAQKIIDMFKNSGLNEYEAITIHDAYKMEQETPSKFPTGFYLNKVKANMPNLLKKGLVDLNTLKFAGVLRLTDKGKTLAKQYIKENINLKKIIREQIEMVELESKLPSMHIFDIADVVRRDWKNIYFGAKPYLEAMQTMSSIKDQYGLDSGKSIVNYFLANAQTWRGEVAKAVKKELNKRVHKG